MTLHSEEAPEFMAIGDLAQSERLAIVALRRWLVGWSLQDAAHWQSAWNELAGALGGVAARGLLRAVEGLVRALCANPRRSLTYHAPCCCALAPDERLLLDLVNACAAVDYARARALAAELVTDDHGPALIAAAEDLADALVRHGAGLPPGATLH